MITLDDFNRLPDAYDKVGLSAVGAREVRERAASLPAGRMVSSDLPRARETAVIVADVVGIDPSTIIIDPIFRELRGPAMRLAFFPRMRLPAKLWSLLRTMSWILGLGQHRVARRDAFARAARAVPKLFEHAGDAKRVLLVAHGAFNIVLALHLRREGLIEEGPWLPDGDYAAATRYVVVRESE
jgi:broad specificity phosphatase PhoE